MRLLMSAVPPLCGPGNATPNAGIEGDEKTARTTNEDCSRRTADETTNEDCRRRADSPRSAGASVGLVVRKSGHSAGGGDGSLRLIHRAIDSLFRLEQRVRFLASINRELGCGLVFGRRRQAWRTGWCRIRESLRFPFPTGEVQLLGLGPNRAPRMDLLLAKLEDAKRYAVLLKYVQQNCRCEQGRCARGTRTQTPLPVSKKLKRDVASSSSPPPSLHAQVVQDYPYEVDGVGDWVSSFKAEAGPWTGPSLVVLSLFDGLGGIWQALTNLGIPFRGYSSEVEQTAIQVVKKRHPTVKHVGDVTKLQLSDIPEKVDLVIGGFPCQDLSIMGKKEGLHGSRSKLFFDLLRVIRDFQPKWFLAENVASMSWIDREEITRHLGLPPLELDSQELTASKRRRLYWTNIPHPPHLPQLRDHPTAQLQHCLENATAIEDKCGVILCSNLYKGSTARLEFVLDSKTKLPRYMRPPEVEELMGYPRDYTNVVVKKKIDQVPNARSPKTPKARPPPSPVQPASTRQLRKNRVSRRFFIPEVWETKITKQGVLKDPERWNLLGNTFSVKVIAYLTSPLLQNSIRSQGKPVNITGSVKEEELSAMEPGDVWALFNGNGKPNWYAVIKSRTGDRFSAIPDHSRKKVATKLPLQVEMQYLELTDNYLGNEVDGWNSQRGTGLFKLRSIVDVQTSWQAFSHRVTSFSKFEDSYFVYPGNDEVWSIYCPTTQFRYFVYVAESTMKNSKLLADKPGQEEFVARCIVLLKTTEHEVFRKTGTEMVFTDLEKFEFRAPFHLKQEAGLLKVEVSGLKGRIKSRAGSDEELLYDEYDADGLTAEELMAEVDLEAELATPVDDAANGAGTSSATPDGSVGPPLEA